MGDLLAGIGWFFGWMGLFCGLAVLFNAEAIIEAWRDVMKGREK